MEPRRIRAGVVGVGHMGQLSKNGDGSIF
jgi:hypothetical protein